MKYLNLQNFADDEQIKILSLNRPQVKNSFHPEMISEITQVFKNFNQDKKIKAVVLKGEGDSFCAGADLNWMKQMVQYTFEENIQDSENLWNMFEAVKECRAVLVGVVHGAAYGGALGLIAACDYVIADEKSKFCFSEVKLGLAPAVISSFVLRKIPDTFVRPYMLSAEVFNAHQAQRVGLVHQVVSDNGQWTHEIKKFSANGLEAMQETKKLLNEISSGTSWEQQKQMTTQLISERRISQEAQQRLKNFLLSR